MSRKPAKKPAKKKAAKKTAAKPAKKAAKRAAAKGAGKPSGYKLIDPRPLVKENPYTYFVPTPKQLADIAPGDKVYVTFKAVPRRPKWDAERMWVKVTEAAGPRLRGILDNHPDDLPALSKGDKVEFNRWHVISLDWADPRIAARYTDGAREYWERCLVDQAVIDGKLKVEYLYREAPDMTQKDDHYPDSGWRIRGDTRGAWDQDIQKREAAYVALGLVLNQDDSWLHLIDEPTGSAFERNYRTGKYKWVGNRQ
jgi:hypothetical protein